jgi:hypothetical protein
MPRTRRSRNSRKRYSRRQRGGQSAWQHMMNTVGDGQQQLVDSLMTNDKQNIAAKQSNAIVPINNPNAQVTKIPNLSQMGGKRRKHKKGGYWASVIRDALVPFGLFGLQQVYGKRRTRKAKN